MANLKFKTLPCIFCQIIRSQLPADVVYRDRQFVVFKDINPKARVHLLIVPRRHFESINHLQTKDALLVGRMLLLAKKIAQMQGVVENGYRLAFNVGRGAGQVIDHLHLHLLAD